MQTLWTAKVSSHEEFAAYFDHLAGAVDARNEYERKLLPDRVHSSMISGYCGVCKQPSIFLLDRYFAHEQPDGSVVPNYRERLECHQCRLNTRMRGALQFLEEKGAQHHSAIYATEQISPLFAALKARYGNLVGSEYLRDGTASGEANNIGTRHEDGTALTFADESFDYLLSFDVLEHIPDYMQALREMVRCLKPSGTLLLTVPFSIQSASHIERARIVDGEIEHILPPEYHGDILDDGGALCFRHFGWSICEDLKQAGFSDAALHFYWSRELCLLGGWPFLIMATK